MSSPGESTPTLQDVLQLVLKLAGKEGPSYATNELQGARLVEQIFNNLTHVEALVQSTRKEANEACQGLGDELERERVQRRQLETQSRCEQDEVKKLIAEKQTLQRSIKALEDLNGKLQEEILPEDSMRKRAAHTENSRYPDQAVLGTDTGLTDDTGPETSGPGPGLLTRRNDGPHRGTKRRRMSDSGESEAESSTSAAREASYMTEGELARLSVLKCLIRGEYTGDELTRFLRQGGLECKEMEEILEQKRNGLLYLPESMDVPPYFQSYVLLFVFIFESQLEMSRQKAEIKSQSDDIVYLKRRVGDPLLEAWQSHPAGSGRAIIPLMRAIRYLLYAEPETLRRLQENQFECCISLTGCSDGRCLCKILPGSVLNFTDVRRQMTRRPMTSQTQGDGTPEGDFLDVFLSIIRMKDFPKRQTTLLSIVSMLLQANVGNLPLDGPGNLLKLLKDADLECQSMVSILQKLNLHNTAVSSFLPTSTSQYLSCAGLFSPLSLNASKMKKYKDEIQWQEGAHRQSVLQFEKRVSDLQTENTSLKEEAMRHRRTKAEREAECSELNRVLSEVRLRCDVLEFCKQDFEEKAIYWEDRIECHAREIDQLTNKLKESQRRSEEAEQKVLQQKEEVEETEEKKKNAEAALQAALQNLEERFAEEGKDRAELEKMTLGRVETIETLGVEDFSKTQEGLSELEVKKPNVEDKASRSRSEAHMLGETFDELIGKVGTLRKAADVAKELCGDLEAEKRALTFEVTQKEVTIKRRVSETSCSGESFLNTPKHSECSESEADELVGCQKRPMDEPRNQKRGNAQQRVLALENNEADEHIEPPIRLVSMSLERCENLPPETTKLEGKRRHEGLSRDDANVASKAVPQIIQPDQVETESRVMQSGAVQLTKTVHILNDPRNRPRDAETRVAELGQRVQMSESSETQCKSIGVSEEDLLRREGGHALPHGNDEIRATSRPHSSPEANYEARCDPAVFRVKSISSLEPDERPKTGDAGYILTRLEEHPGELERLIIRFARLHRDLISWHAKIQKYRTEPAKP